MSNLTELSKMLGYPGDSYVHTMVHDLRQNEFLKTEQKGEVEHLTVTKKVEEK
jgi:hypothetical protein